MQGTILLVWTQEWRSSGANGSDGKHPNPWMTGMWHDQEAAWQGSSSILHFLSMTEPFPTGINSVLLFGKSFLEPSSNSSNHLLSTEYPANFFLLKK